jgi:uncharacterized protein
MSNIGANKNRQNLNGVGLGLRRDLADFLLSNQLELPSFVELAPENWMDVGGKWGKVLKEICELYPISSHGLSLSIGSPEGLDWAFLKRIKKFLKEHSVRIYSEHLSYSKCNNAHFYDLLPIPFKKDAVTFVAQRIKEVQDFLEMKIAIENVSYYCPVAAEMDEATFITSVINEADCNLLLDINNVYVNSFNHKYDPHEFIVKLPLEKVTYIHMAGHEKRSEDLIIDTHGQAIIEPVYDLFRWAITYLPEVPVLLERDFNYPDFSELLSELSSLQTITSSAWGKANVA